MRLAFFALLCALVQANLGKLKTGSESSENAGQECLAWAQEQAAKRQAAKRDGTLVSCDKKSDPKMEYYLSICLSKKIYAGCISTACGVSDDCRWGVVEVEGNCYAVFRGSSNLKNWLRNFQMQGANFAKVPNYYGTGLLHKGFATTWSHIASNSQYNAAMAQCRNKGKKLIFTGHSFGGAIAVLAYARAKGKHRYNNADYITFGMPKTGDSDFQTWLNNLGGRGKRFESGDATGGWGLVDPVPRLPPAGSWHSKVKSLAAVSGLAALTSMILPSDMAYNGARWATPCNDYDSKKDTIAAGGPFETSSSFGCHASTNYKENMWRACCQTDSFC